MKNKFIQDDENGFSLPDDYFNHHKREILLKTTFDENNTGFFIPENYFENLKSKVFNSIHTPSKAKKISLYTIVNIAGIAAIFVAIILFYFNHSNYTYESKIGSINDAEIYKHFEYNGLQLDLICDAGWCNELLTDDNHMNLDNDLIYNIYETDIINEL